MHIASTSRLLFLPPAPGLDAEQEGGTYQFATDLTTRDAKTESIRGKLRQKSISQTRDTPGPTCLGYLSITLHYCQKQFEENLLLSRVRYNCEHEKVILYNHTDR